MVRLGFAWLARVGLWLAWDSLPRFAWLGCVALGSGVVWLAWDSLPRLVCEGSLGSSCVARLGLAYGPPGLETTGTRLGGCGLGSEQDTALG